MTKWPSIQLRRFARLKSGDFISADEIEPEGEYPVYGGNGLRGFTNSSNTKGPIAVIGRQGAHCGNVQIVEGQAWVSEHALRCFPEKPINVSFIRYALDSLNLGQYSVSAAQPGLSTDNIKPLPVSFPPTHLQDRIAAFLDEKTAKIDALIEKKQKLLERLAEKRQAIITQAVTRGLNPSAPMKDSGIDWLGQIPAHWVVAAVGYRYEVQLGRMLNAERSSGDYPKPYLRVFDVQWDKINVSDLPEMDFPPEAQARYRLQAGDLLVNEGGSYVGRAAMWRGELEECYYQKALHRLRAYDETRDTAEFLYFVMEAATTNAVFIAGGNQTTIDHLTAEQLRHYRFAFPPLSEQQSISTTLRERLQTVAQIARKIELSVEWLNEHRSALITAAVTGQIEELC